MQVLCFISGFAYNPTYYEATQPEVLWIFHVFPLNWCHNKFSSTHLWCKCIPNILWTIDSLKTSHADWCQVANWSCICFLWNQRAGRRKIHVLNSLGFLLFPSFSKALLVQPSLDLTDKLGSKGTWFSYIKFGMSPQTHLCTKEISSEWHNALFPSYFLLLNGGKLVFFALFFRWVFLMSSSIKDHLYVTKIRILLL